jgi:hypothetical protein
MIRVTLIAGRVHAVVMLYKRETDSVGLTIHWYRNKNKPRDFICVSLKKMSASIRSVRYPFCPKEPVGGFIDPASLYESFGSFQRTP